MFIFGPLVCFLWRSVIGGVWALFLYPLSFCTEKLPYGIFFHTIYESSFLVSIEKVNGSWLGYPFFYCLQTTLRKECVLWTLFLLGTLHCPPLKLYNVHHLYLAVFSIPFLFCLLLTFMLRLLNRIWLVQPYLWTFCNLKSISLIAKNVFGSCPLTALILSYPQKNFSSNY